MIEFAHLVSCLHFRLIALLRLILERNELYDVNSTQAFILLTVGDGELRATDLLAYGFNYYSLYGMIEKGYMAWNLHQHDRRSGFYKLTDKGRKVVTLFHQVFQDHVKEMDEEIDFDQLIPILGQIDSFYVDQTQIPHHG